MYLYQIQAKLKWLKNMYAKTDEKQTAHLVGEIQAAEQNNTGEQYAKKL